MAPEQVQDIERRNNAECNFGYMMRSFTFKFSGELTLHVMFILTCVWSMNCTYGSFLPQTLLWDAGSHWVVPLEQGRLTPQWWILVVCVAMSISLRLRFESASQRGPGFQAG